MTSTFSVCICADDASPSLQVGSTLRVVRIQDDSTLILQKIDERKVNRAHCRARGQPNAFPPLFIPTRRPAPVLKCTKQTHLPFFRAKQRLRSRFLFPARYSVASEKHLRVKRSIAHARSSRLSLPPRLFDETREETFRLFDAIESDVVKETDRNEEDEEVREGRKRESMFEPDMVGRSRKKKMKTT